MINSINEALRCVELFMNNKFHEATELGQKHAHDSLYHACITGLLKFLNGILSLEKVSIGLIIVLYNRINCLASFFGPEKSHFYSFFSTDSLIPHFYYLKSKSSK